MRVFARVRPFLPGDGDVDAASVPTVDCKSDGQGVLIRRPASQSEDRVAGAPGASRDKAAHSFAYDKCFPPSKGQEDVFQEVSEFVQSALDGYNVCLFSYGQTGSGKTHTMQGSGGGPMRGIIPRAIEQVGSYKAKLETQGWERCGDGRARTGGESGWWTRACPEGIGRR